MLVNAALELFITLLIEIQKMTHRLVIYLGLLFFVKSVHAQQFFPPEKITYSGKTYSLAYKNPSSNGQEIFEYTTNNEPIENWSSLVTLNFKKSLVTTPLKWAESLKTALGREKPIPHYSLYLQGNNGFSKIIYEPDSKNPFYESNVHKSFHIEACGGTLVLQFAHKYPPGTDQSSEGKLTTLKQIAIENSQFALELEKSEWLPMCN